VKEVEEDEVEEDEVEEDEVEEDEVVEVVEEMEALAGRAGWGILAPVGLCGVFVGGGV